MATIHKSRVFETTSDNAATFRATGQFLGRFIYFPIAVPDLFTSTDISPTLIPRTPYTFICRITRVDNLATFNGEIPVTQGGRFELPLGTYSYEIVIDPDCDFAKFSAGALEAAVQVIGSEQKVTLPRDYELVGKQYREIATYTGGSGTNKISIPWWANEVRVFFDGTGTVEIHSLDMSDFLTGVLARLTDYGEFVTALRSGRIAINDTAGVGTISVFVR